MFYAHIENEHLLGWYNKDIHVDSIPEGCICVTEEVWQEALNINANAYVDGKFTTKDFRSKEEKERDVRHSRNMLLEELDSVVSNPIRWEGMSVEEKELVKEYRQCLLDIPQQKGFPDDIIYPDKPNFM